MLNGIIEYDGRHTISSLNSIQVDTRDVSNDIMFIRDTDWTFKDLLIFNRNFKMYREEKRDRLFNNR